MTKSVSLATIINIAGLVHATAGGVPVAALNSDLPAMSATVGGAVPTPPNDATKFLTGIGTWEAPGGIGTVTGVSVASAHGFGGTVATSTSTPVITLTTSITGLLKGDGTGVTAAINSDLPTMSSSVGGAVPTPPNDVTKFLTGIGTWLTPPGGGTLTAVSVASANGFAGTSGGGSTPVLTLTTTITGLLKGNSVAISAAVAGTDYSRGTSALATGIVKSTTTTGVLSIALNADLPVMSATVGGAVPTPPNNTTMYLRADGSWATPTGTGPQLGTTNPWTGLNSWSAASTFTGLLTANGPFANVTWPVGFTPTAVSITRTAPVITNVHAAMFVGTTSNASSTADEWNALFVLNNNTAGAAENVALYSQAYKNSSSPTWGCVLEVHDTSGDYTQPLYGLEIDLCSDGLDPNNNRIGIGLFYGHTNAFAGHSSLARQNAAIEIAPFDATWDSLGNGIWLNGAINYGINHSQNGFASNAILGGFTDSAIYVSSNTTLPAVINIANTNAVAALAKINAGNSVWSAGGSIGSFAGTVAMNVGGVVMKMPLFNTSGTPPWPSLTAANHFFGTNVFDAATTFSNTIFANSFVSMSANCAISGALGVSGLTSCATFTAAGASTFGSTLGISGLCSSAGGFSTTGSVTSAFSITAGSTTNLLDCRAAAAVSQLIALSSSVGPFYFNAAAPTYAGHKLPVIVDGSQFYIPLSST